VGRETGAPRRKGVPRDDRRVAGQRHSGQLWLIVRQPGDGGIVEPTKMGQLDVLELRDAAWEDSEGRVPIDVDYDPRPMAMQAGPSLVLIEGGEDATPVVPLRPRVAPELPEAA
jgi:hypothetical protein